MRFTRVVPGLAAATLSFGLLAACGQATAGSDAQPVAALTQDSFVSSITSAVADAGSAHVSAEGSLMGLPLALEGDVTGGEGPDDFALALASADGGIDFRLVDQVAYAKANPFTGGQFVSVDLTDSDDPLVAQLESFRDKVDVGTLLAAADEAISVEASGGEAQTLDGVETTGYDVTVDTAKLAESDPTGRAPQSVELTVYVGADDLPRRIVIDDRSTPLTIDFSAWGEAVEVVAPAAGEISDQSASALLGGFTRAS